MNSSNSFNICPRCGNSNALNAKYCSRCGGQLKVPEEPVVCHKCHTHNTPMANFCRNCGTALKVGSETKICPRCGAEVSGNQAICSCGYSFVTYQQTAPSAHPVDAASLRELQSHGAEQPVEEQVSTLHRSKSGRGWAIAAILFVLIFAYLIVAPFQIFNSEGVLKLTVRPNFLSNFDKGLIYTQDGDNTTLVYGYGFVTMLVDFIKGLTQGTSFKDAIGTMSIGYIMVTLLTVIFIVTAFIHLLVAIIRSFTAKRSRKMNVYFLIMAIISTLVVGLMLLFKLVAMPEGFLQKVAGWFAIKVGETEFSLGYALWAIPLYFWFFFLYSLGAKAKHRKEQE